MLPCSLHPEETVQNRNCLAHELLASEHRKEAPTIAKRLLPFKLWQERETLLPPPPRTTKGPAADNGKALRDIDTETPRPNRRPSSGTNASRVHRGSGSSRSGQSPRISRTADRSCSGINRGRRLGSRLRAADPQRPRRRGSSGASRRASMPRILHQMQNPEVAK